MRPLVAFCACVCVCTVAGMTIPTDLPSHPRLVVNDTLLNKLVKLASVPSEAADIYTAIKSRADDILANPDMYPVITPINCTVAGACRGPWWGSGSNNFQNTNDVSENVPLLAFVHRFEAARTQSSPRVASPYSDRAIKGLLAAAAFPSWQWPVAQALEHSMLTWGSAIGVDWLYDTMTTDQRETVVNATMVLGLETHLHSQHEQLWWTRDVYNWVLVSNAGPIAAALALSTESSDANALASNVLTGCLKSMDKAMKSWGPSGVWPEGPSYWSFAISHVFKAASALESALGDDQGLMGFPGLRTAGYYAVTMNGPVGESFSWGDSEPGSPAPSELIFLASHFQEKPLAAWVRRFMSEHGAPGDVLALAYYAKMPTSTVSDIGDIPLNKVYADPNPSRTYGRKTHLGFFRSSWFSDPKSTSWAGFKGGQNLFDDGGSSSHNNHGHQDVSNFVLEMYGVRWAIDMGGGEYDFPLISYFGRFRFSYYRTSSHGHNVLSFDGESQSRLGSGAIIDATLSSGAPSAVVNATAAYATSPGDFVNRTLSFSEDFKVFTVADRWRRVDAKTVTWKMHTLANVTVAPTGATLTHRDATRALRMDVSSPGATLVTASLLKLPFPEDGTVDGAPVTVVTVTVPAASEAVTVTFY